MSDRIGHADCPAPIVYTEHEVPELEPLDQAGEVLAVRLEGVAVMLRFVRKAATEVVGRNHPVTLTQRRDEVAVVVAPGRIAVQEQQHWRITRALVEIVKTAHLELQPV